MPAKIRPQPTLVQLFDLTLIQLSNWRWSWRSMLLTGVAAPMMSILALGVFARNSGEETLGYILTGNLVLALMFGTLDKVSSNFAYMRFGGMLTYFASLPIYSASLILATILAFFLLSLPAVGVTMLVGVLYLGVNVKIHWTLLVVLPLAAASMAGLGALIGARARSPEEAGSISLLLTLILAGLGPVLIPPDRLPAFMNILGYFSPATYAASALRQTLLGPLSARLLVDLGVLLVVAVLVLWLVGRTIHWRRNLV